MTPTPGCAFCDYDGPSPIVAEAPGVIAFRPLNPVTEGHLLFVPEVHVEDATEAPAITALVMAAASDWARGVGDCNLITSVGEAATQTVKHLHIHLVPRSVGDGLALPWSRGGIA